MISGDSRSRGTQKLESSRQNKAHVKKRMVGREWGLKEKHLFKIHKKSNPTCKLNDWELDEASETKFHAQSKGDWPMQVASPTCIAA